MGFKIGYDAKRAYQNYTGLGNYSRDLLKNILNNFPENQYVLYAPKSTKNPRLSFLADHKNVETRFPNTSLHKTFKGYWRSINLEKTLEKDKIDIFHGLSNEMPRSRQSNIKYVVTIHDLIFKRYPRNYRSIDRKIHNVKFKYAARNADLTIAISEQTKRDIVDFYKINPNKIKVLYQSCHDNFRREYPQEVINHIKEKFQLPNNFILNVGTIETRKNLNAILQAIPIMKSDLPIVVVGRKTKYFNFLKVQMKKLKIESSRILFLNNVSIEELPSIYKLADLFIYPSLFEGFGIPIIESLISGTPVITSKDGCFTEAGGKDSLYIDPLNYDEIAHTIDNLLSDTEKQQIMAAKGKEFVKKFDPNKLSSELMEIYQSLI
ncbi:MAG: glycosyltransferase family 1 protein [Flavobacteriales bacterium]|nr:glycosyltransferase family 1 protein [Flavobacteriales bacterium]